MHMVKEDPYFLTGDSIAEAYETAYKTGFETGFSSGEEEGFADGYAKGLSEIKRKIDKIFSTIGMDEVLDKELIKLTVFEGEE